MVLLVYQLRSGDLQFQKKTWNHFTKCLRTEAFKKFYLWRYDYLINRFLYILLESILLCHLIVSYISRYFIAQLIQIGMFSIST